MPTIVPGSYYTAKMFAEAEPQLREMGIPVDLEFDVSYTSYADTFSYIADVSVSDDETFFDMLGEAFDQGMETDENES